MEHILKDKNENVSSGQLVISSKSDTELSSENLKENHNPKSLIEIAADTSSKFLLDASTPKNSKRSSNFKDLSFNFNSKGNDSFIQQDSAANNPISISFLTDGLNNLKFNKTDATLSDDEEQFLSFNDASNRGEDKAKSIDGNENANNDATLILEQNNSEEAVCEEKVSLNEVKSDNLIENVNKEEIVNDASLTVEPEPQSRPSEMNMTVEGDKMEVKDGEDSQQNVLNITKEKEKSPVKEVEIQGVENNLALSVIRNEGNCTVQQGNNPINQDEINNDLVQFQSEPNMTVEIKKNSLNSEEIRAEQFPIEQKNELNVTIEKETAPAEEVEMKMDIDETFAVPETLVQQNELNVTAPIEMPQLNEPESLNNTTSVDHSSDSISGNVTHVLSNDQESEFANKTFEEIENASEKIQEIAPDVDENAKKSLENKESQQPNLRSDNFNITFENTPHNLTNTIVPNLDVEFKMPSAPVSRKSTEKVDNFDDEEFTSAISYNFGDSDFDFLQKFGSNSSNQNFGRDSVLLKFDPLLAKPVPQVTSPNFPKLVEEDELSSSINKEENRQQQQQQEEHNKESSELSRLIDDFSQLIPLDNKAMSVEIMKDIVSENEKQINNLECEETKLSSFDHHENQNNKLLELENKMKMEAEQREEVLLKRISEKDKQISKMNNVVKEYEKAIAELIAEKEQLVQNYDKKCADLKNDSEMNAQHLASLESTFSDLHAKYERTKQLASDLKEREEQIVQDRKTLMDNLKMQEARYEKMKMHAMSQLEIANNKLAEMLRNHQAEVTKLKAQLKKEEISRASINEQLIQKSKENAELVKICDELIGNHGNSHAV